MGGKKRERRRDKVEYISVIEGILFPIIVGREALLEISRRGG